VARNVRKIAHAPGAHVVGRVPETGGGAFGAARLAEVLRNRLTPGSGRRPGRPTDPNWVKHPKVPMSEETFRGLERLAEELSTPRRRVSPMQLAAQLLETSVEQITGDSAAPR
jgi:hypothetical protein